MATTTKLSATTGESIHSQDMQLDEKLISSKVKSLCSVRYGIAYVVHLCNFILMAQYTIMNITMVAMVNSTEPQPQFNISTEGLPVNSLGDPNKAPKSLPAGVPVYNWSPQAQGLIFGSLNYGIILTSAPSGYLAGRVGIKKVVGVGLFGSSLIILCIPLAADLGVVFLVIIRTVQGLCQGSIVGGQFALWEKWSPPQERSRLFTIALSGMMLGAFTAILLGGFISQVIGWPFAFYIFGIIGCVCGILWVVLVYDDPISHPWISISEKEYIISSLTKQFSSSRPSLPIKAMVRSLPLWSLILCCFSHHWLVIVMTVYTPTYISSVYNINLRDNGIVSALPFIFAWFFSILGGLLADFLLTKNFRLVTVRKIATVLGNLPSSIILAVLPYLRSSYITTVTLLTIASGLSSLCQSGIYINALDIAPRHSSFLMGASRSFGLIAGVLVPTISGFLLSQDPEFGWRNVFLLLFFINILGLIFYLIFGKADIQDWAEEKKCTHL
ncbi:PREDICTED: sodium-dependent phosphate transport protein 4 [Chrysochloris asiatica]|uniref:Sodium-dependent phosphate transport protein 4 n=1 Tax=Chrysochloris asiatica TaxID=185453 RepID=A0A9B0WY17_CHRAS|nr:PREDICTED: sodium-dependent phosphate transport protein 4 [Chrysochloris asiatica]